MVYIVECEKYTDTTDEYIPMWRLVETDDVEWAEAELRREFDFNSHTKFTFHPMLTVKQKYKRCPLCNGVGEAAVQSSKVVVFETCPMCKGNKKVKV